MPTPEEAHEVLDRFTKHYQARDNRIPALIKKINAEGNQSHARQLTDARAMLDKRRYTPRRHISDAAWSRYEDMLDATYQREWNRVFPTVDEGDER